MRFRSEWPSDPPNVYAVGDADGWVLVDSGWGYDDDMADLRNWLSDLLGPPLRSPVAMAITHGHPDHAGGAARLFEAWPHVPLLAGRDEASVLHRHFPRLSFQSPDPEGIRLSSGVLRPFPAPGHTTGSLAWIWEPAQDRVSLSRSKRVVLSGDTVLGRLSSWIGPPDGDLDVYLSTLSRLTEAFGPDILAPGHGPVCEPLAERTRALRARRLARDEEILALLPGLGTARALAQALYEGKVPRSTLAPGGMAERTVLGHLLHLARQGRVHVASSDASGDASEDSAGDEAMTRVYQLGPG